MNISAKQKGINLFKQEDNDWDNNPSKDPAAWAIKISASWQKAPVAIIRTGQLLIDSKEQVPHGQWGKMFEGPDRLPFSEDTARCLMAIARNPVLSKAENSRLLPASWYGLYELSQIADEKLEVLIANGTINPNLKGKHIDAIIKEHSDKGSQFVWRDLWSSLATLINFMQKWPEPYKPAVELAYNKTISKVPKADMAALADWLGKLSVAYRDALNTDDEQTARQVAAFRDRQANEKVEAEVGAQHEAEEKDEADEEEGVGVPESERAAPKSFQRVRLKERKGEKHVTAESTDADTQ